MTNPTMAVAGFNPAPSVQRSAELTVEVTRSFRRALRPAIGFPVAG